MTKNDERYPFERVILPALELAKKWSHRALEHFNINCLMCNVTMRVTAKQLHRKFCGNVCKYASLVIEHRGLDHFKRSGQWIECLCCKHRFWMKQSKIDIEKGKYCSRECYISSHPMKTKYPRRLRVCHWCQVEFTVSQGKTAPTYCSISCSQLHSFASGRRPPMKGRINGRFGKPPKYVRYDRFVDRLGRDFRLRSSYEIALVEQCLDPLEMTWNYELKTFDLGTTTYTPDFWVEEFQSFVEVKGWFRPKAQAKVELFKLTYPNVPLVVASKQVLQEHFGLDLSTRSLEDIKKRYNAKSFVRKDQRGTV